MNNKIYSRGIPHCVPRSCDARRVFSNKMERVSVYIDGANFFGGLRTIDERYTDTKFDFEKYIKHSVGQRKLIAVYYYNASLKQEKNPEIFKKQQRLLERLRRIENFNVILCRRQKRTDSDGQSYFVIKGDDIRLAIDMLNDAWENKFDTAILMSGDGDFAPLVENVKKKGKKVESHHFQANVSLDLLNQSNINITIDKKTVNKFFYRQDSLTVGDILKDKL